MLFIIFFQERDVSLLESQVLHFHLQERGLETRLLLVLYTGQGLHARVFLEGDRKSLISRFWLQQVRVHVLKHPKTSHSVFPLL